MHFTEKFKVVIWLIVLVAILGAWLGWSESTVSTLTEWLVSIGIGIITSGIAGTFVERLSGDFFKTIFIPIEIGPISFSISLFPIVTLIVKFWLF